jgi:hypothetical protein
MDATEPKDYEKPELISLGSLAELTQGSTTAVPDTTFTGSLAPISGP